MSNQNLFWGCNLATWVKKLRLERKRGLSICQRSIAKTTSIAFANSVLATLQSALFRNSLHKTVVRPDPIFVIGHWRSGTTLLHELLSLDANVSFPNNYCCFMPHHFLLTERRFGPSFNEFTSTHRPMDEGLVTWDAPQEDEFATMAMGADSVYWRFGFPTKTIQPFHEFDYRDEDRSWEKAYQQFIRTLSYRSQNRLILKSPTHSFRIERLSQLFPQSTFVHVVRDPFDVLLSFKVMLEKMSEFASFERTEIGDDERLAECIISVDRQINESVKKLDDDRYVVVKFENLVNDTFNSIGRLRQSLGFCPSEDYSGAVSRYFQIHRYHPSRKTQRDLQLSPSTLLQFEEIRGRYVVE